MASPRDRSVLMDALKAEKIFNALEAFRIELPSHMGRYKFSSWTLHMASIIIFSTLWGIALKEWKGAGGRTKLLLAFSLRVLVSSTVIVGYGNYVGGSSH